MEAYPVALGFELGGLLLQQLHMGAQFFGAEVCRIESRAFDPFQLETQQRVRVDGLTRLVDVVIMTTCRDTPPSAPAN